MQPHPHPVGPKVNILEDPLEMATADLIDQAAFFGSFDKLIQGWRGTAVLLCLVAGQSHQFKPRLVGNTSWPPGPLPLHEPRLAPESCLLPPFANGRLGDTKFRCDRFCGFPLVGHQGDPGTQHVTLWAGLLADDGFQVGLILGRELNVKGRAAANHATSLSAPC